MTTPQKKKPATHLTVTIARAEYGTAQPRITVTMPKGSTYRESRAAQMQLSAQVELASEGHRWGVHLSDDVMHYAATTATVYLELDQGSAAELAAAEQVLRQIAGGK